MQWKNGILPMENSIEKYKKKTELLQAASFYNECLEENKCLEEFLVWCDLQCFKYVSKHKLLNPFAIHWFFRKSEDMFNMCMPFFVMSIGFAVKWSWIALIIQVLAITFHAYIAFQMSKAENNMFMAKIDRLEHKLPSFKM